MPATLEAHDTATRTLPCDCGAQRVEVDVVFCDRELRILQRVTGSDCPTCGHFEVLRA